MLLSNKPSDGPPPETLTSVAIGVHVPEGIFPHPAVILVQPSFADN
jgi:hypothetical protein